MPRDWWVSTDGALSGPQRAEEDAVCGRLRIRQVGMTLIGRQESGKASGKRGGLGSQGVRDLEGVGESFFSGVSKRSALSCGE